MKILGTNLTIEEYESIYDSLPLAEAHTKSAKEFRLPYHKYNEEFVIPVYSSCGRKKFYSHAYWTTDGDIEAEYIRMCTNHFGELVGPHAHIVRQFAFGCDTILDMGMNVGNFTRAIIASYPKKVVSADITVDPPGHPGINKNIIKNPQLNLAKLCEKNNIDFTFINKSAIDIEPQPCDFISIDDKHTYEHVMKELELFSPMCSKYISFHDAAYAPIAKAINDFLANNKNWKIVWNNRRDTGFVIIERVA